ncbi:MAG: 16S rRNA (adenine(1518)-N(6)/adenine(1519)-N(6))-dimethyltransferase RsmA [Alphaproteobacteria bacterium]|nr:16S rRNA (adenine(1518)-N(6)/adenine(1519)-N(6))-dimethyltransferase RsmA [Alphaproteobacteria bacterium]
MLPTLRETVDFYGLMANKALGQNFLLDSNITDKIIRRSLAKQEISNFNNFNIIEVGPGPGGLTRSILQENPKSLTVVEMDSRCIKIMEDLRPETDSPMNIINGDALEFDIKENTSAPRQIISNLPYNVSVPLLIKWLQEIKNISAMTLMFQKEVAERIMAPTHCKDYGRVSVIAQLTCQIDKLMDLNPECFTPAPKIWSSVLLFRPLNNAINKEEIAKVEKITSLAFGQRRKMLRQSLKSLSGINEKLEKLGISSTCRAEELTPQQFLDLSRLF